MLKRAYDIIIIGSGPAGLTASIYAIRSNHSTLVIAGTTPGGQLMITTDVDDFPGFPGGIQGPKLMAKVRKQCEMLGVDFIDENATKVDLKGTTKKIWADKKMFKAKAVIIATGASARWLGLESEKKLTGKGISACAVCDGFAFKGKDVIVIGGGDTAMREALFLSKICKRVTVVHRRDKLKAQAALENKAQATKNINWIWNSVVEEFLGKNKLETVKLKNISTNKTSELRIQGAFVAIGHKPNTEFLKGQVDLDDHGYVSTKNYVRTNLEGVFVSGDVHDYVYMQAVTAAGAGCMAAMDARDYLEDFKHKKKN